MSGNVSQWGLFRVPKKGGMVELAGLHPTEDAARAEAVRLNTPDSPFRYSTMPVSAPPPPPVRGSIDPNNGGE